MMSAKRPPGPALTRLAREFPGIFRDPLAFVLSMHDSYGDTVLLDGWVRRYYLIRHPTDIQRVLQTNQDNYGKLSAFQPVLGEGLSVSEGESWRRQRRQIQPAFDPDRLAALSWTMTDAARELLERWDELANGATVDLMQEMTRLALDVAGRTMFGMDLRERTGELAVSLSFLQRSLQRRFFLRGSPAKWLFRASKRRFDEAMARIDQIVYELIDARRRSAGDRRDLLSLLLESGRTGETMSDRMIRDNVFVLLLGGYETTAAALTWTFVLLSRNPEVRRQLEEELDRVLAGSQPAFADVPELVYTRMVIDESLRLFPPAWVIPRLGKENDDLGGFRIRRGSTVLISVYAVHRNPAWWDTPDDFCPERFQPTQRSSRPSHAYVPFGGGPRKCTGYAFALLEMTLILATIARRYRLDAIEGERLEAEPLVVLRPRGRVRMCVIRRPEGWVGAQRRSNSEPCCFSS